MADKNANIISIFREALEEPDLAARAAYLDRACASNADLRRRVEALLGAFASTAATGEPGAVQSKEPPTEASPHTPHDLRPGEMGTIELSSGTPNSSLATEEFQPGSTIGSQAASRTSADPIRYGVTQVGTVIAERYTLVALIGEGGMGSVYRADQTEPVKRQVALKLIKAGMDSHAMLARFDAERQALALMDHPNIARIYDGGVTPWGQPYFVMELVRGVPLTAFCDRNRLSVNQRLRLFVSVCQAVQHAHQKGIIHRDLKPGNVLVTEVDGRPTPKVIDFGVAKATAQKLTDMSYTDVGVVGTPEYMSPEQADPSSVDIDTRTDVYALGVMLYELLVGSTPIDAKQLKRGAVLEMLRMVREDEPPRPSTKLSTAEALPSIAANRNIEPVRLTRLLRGELDWVVMKALEKDRTRRYETASGFARDIERYLADEPVEARPPSAGYRLRKFARRHRGPVLAAALIALALVGGIVGTTLGLVEARRQQGLAEAAAEAETRRAEAEVRERQRAELAEAQARQRANELEEMAQFQAKQFENLDVPLTGVRLRADLLKKVREEAAKAKLEPAKAEARVAEVERDLAGVDFAGMALKTLEQNVFQPALPAIDKQFADQPLVRARLQQTLAVTTRELGLLDLAMKPQAAALKTRREQLGNNHVDTLVSMRNQSSLLRMRGQVKEAEALLQEALDGFRAQFGEDDIRTIECVNLFGTLRQGQGRWGEAAKFHAQALPGFRRLKGEDDQETLDILSQLGAALTNMGKYDEAEKLLLEAYQKLNRVAGADNLRTIAAANNLGAVYLGMDRYDDTDRYYRLALEGLRRTAGDLHPFTISSMDNLGTLLARRDRPDEALVFLNQAFKNRQLLYGNDHATTLRSFNNLGFAYRKQLKFAEAEANYRLALDGFRRLVGPNRPDTFIIASNLGMVLKDQRKYDEAEATLRTVMNGRRSVLGAAQRDTLAATVNLADVLDQLHREDESLRLLVEDEKPARNAYTGSQRRMLGDYLSRLGDGLLRAGRLKESEAALGEAQKLLIDGYGPRDDSSLQCTDRQIDLYARWHAAEPGKGYDAKSAQLIQQALKATIEQVAETRKKVPAGSTQLAGELAKAGARLLKLQRFAEAEPLLQESFTLRTKLQPDTWTTFSTQALLGAAWLGQKNYAKAEPLLLGGCTEMKKRETRIPPASRPILVDSMGRLVQVYEAQGRPDEAANWRKEVDAATKKVESSKQN